MKIGAMLMVLLGALSTVQAAPPPLACAIDAKVDPRDAPWTRGGWQAHGVVRLNGSAGSLTVPARLNVLGGQWEYNNSQMPYLVWMPERRRLMLAASVDKPEIKAVVVFSDDLGETWTRPRWLHTNAAGAPDVAAATQLTYLGGGKLLLGLESQYWGSTDYGETWSLWAPVPASSEGKPLYPWDPMFVDRDPTTGQVTRLLETRYQENGAFDTAGYFSQGCLRTSSDEGKTWGAETKVPQWKGANEIVLCRAQNGDLVAACRTDNAPQFLGRCDDQYSGLATAVSHDEGRTWSELNRLYEWGRHHPGLVAMPNGDLVLTYVVRKGYAADKDGRNRFGIEALLSHDHGQSWDLDHKYLLAVNSSVMSGERADWGSPQSTSNVLLPEGDLLTTFCTGAAQRAGADALENGRRPWSAGGPATSRSTARRRSARRPINPNCANRFDLDAVK